MNNNPPTPKPLYPDTPWWASLVAVLVTAVVSVVGTVVFMKGGTGAGEFKMPTGLSILVDTVTYIPHIILLFGVLADMFTYEGVYSIPSLVGVLSIFVNYIFRYFWVGLDSLIDSAKKTIGTPEEPSAPVGGKSKKGGGVGDWFRDYDGCNVQGFESFGSRFAPQTLVITATVFSYYIFDLIKNRGWLNSTAAIIVGATVFVTEALIIQSCDVISGPDAGKQGPGVIGKALRALAEGFLFGGTSFAVVQTYYPERLPSAVLSPFPKRSRSELSPGPDGKLYDKDGYPWVVLPNGQTFPDMSTPAARKAFSDVAEKSIGSSSDTGSGCSSSDSVSTVKFGTGRSAVNACPS